MTFDYEKRRAEGKLTEDDPKQIESEQAAYVDEIAEKSAWLDKQNNEQSKQTEQAEQIAVDE